MSKSVTTALANHLQGELTSLSTCWRITRRDGNELFFTDHDTDISFEGNTYLASVGYTRTAVQNASNLSPDNLDVMGILADDALTEQDLRAGLYDYAEVRLFIVNWADLSQGALKMRRGTLGEVILTSQGYFSAELRGLAQALSQTIGELYSASCRADLGDSRCKKPIDPAEVARNTVYSVGDYVKADVHFTRLALVNADAETGDTSGWISDTGTLVNTGASRVTPYDGTHCFGPTTTDTAFTCHQTIDVPSGMYSDIDLGNLSLRMRTYMFTANGATCKANIDFLDASDVSLLLTSNAFASFLTWTDFTDIRAIPEGTRRIKFVFDSIYDGSHNNNGFFDAVRLDIAASFDDNTYDIYGDRIFKCTTRGTTHKVDKVAYNTAIGGTTTDGTAVFTAEQAWSRSGVVTSVTDRRHFVASIDDALAVDGWYDGGVVTWDSGLNAGRAVEVKQWTQSGGVIEIFLPLPFTASIGDKFHIYAGCDKALATCRDKFDNVVNFRGEPYVPGQDEYLSYPGAQ